MKFKIETGNTNKVLRKKSEKIQDSEIKKYAKIGSSMVKFLKNPDNAGVGLAAPQIGINKRIIAVSLLKTYEDEIFKTIMMINPEILEFSEEQCIENEGCLSVPKVFGDVKRPIDIKLKYIDEKGKDNIINLSGISSRIVQHEIDHLDGILFIDKLADDLDVVSNHIL